MRRTDSQVEGEEIFICLWARPNLKDKKKRERERDGQQISCRGWATGNCVSEEKGLIDSFCSINSPAESFLPLLTLSISNLRFVCLVHCSHLWPTTPNKIWIDNDPFPPILSPSGKMFVAAGLNFPSNFVWFVLRDKIFCSRSAGVLENHKLWIINYGLSHARPINF